MQIRKIKLGDEFVVLPVRSRVHHATVTVIGRRWVTVADGPQSWRFDPATMRGPDGVYGSDLVFLPHEWREREEQASARRHLRSWGVSVGSDWTAASVIALAGFVETLRENES